MLLSEIFDQLTYGELSSVAMGGRGASGIIENDFPMIINHINLGLTEIHKRLDLRREELIVQQYDQIQQYYLEPRFAVSNVESSEPIKYITDSEENPFLGNVLRVERIINEDGQELYVNDENQYCTVWTPTYNSIQVPLPAKENSMCVTYRANHRMIDPSSTSIKNTEIHLPHSHLEALLYYVAARILPSIPTLDPNNNESANYLAKFEASIMKLQEIGLTNKNNPSNHRLCVNGWV